MDIPSKNCRVDHLSSLYQFRPVVDILRLDEVHPVVSGNKWFKLKEYLKDAEEQGKKLLLTFGGAYSNHIVATAAAAQMKGFTSIGIIRGEEPNNLSHSLKTAGSYGMKLYFVSREVYKQKLVTEEVFNEYNKADIYMIPEGGYGEKGMSGAQDILLQNNTSAYTHVVCAVGTGTTLAGMISAALPHQKIIGISVLRNNQSLQREIKHLLPSAKHSSFELLHDYHFGGYAKHTQYLFEFMNELYATAAVPTDFVYTAKVFYAVFDMEHKGYFTPKDKILLIHTGGLPGNLSLPKGTLIY